MIVSSVPLGCASKNGSILFNGVKRTTPPYSLPTHPSDIKTRLNCRYSTSKGVTERDDGPSFFR